MIPWQRVGWGEPVKPREEPVKPSRQRVPLVTRSRTSEAEQTTALTWRSSDIDFREWILTLLAPSYDTVLSLIVSGLYEGEVRAEAFGALELQWEIGPERGSGEGEIASPFSTDEGNYRDKSVLRESFLWFQVLSCSRSRNWWGRRRTSCRPEWENEVKIHRRGRAFPVRSVSYFDTWEKVGVGNRVQPLPGTHWVVIYGVFCE